MKKNLFYIILITSTSLFGFNGVDTFFIQYKNSNIEEAKTIAENSPYSEFLRYYIYLNNREDFKDNEGFTDIPITDSISYVLHHINQGLYDYLFLGNELAAIKKLRLAIIKAQEIENSVLLCEAIKVCLEIYQRFTARIGEQTYSYFLEAYNEHTYDEFEKSNFIIKKFLLDHSFGQITKPYSDDYLVDIKKHATEISKVQYQYDGLIALAVYFQHAEKDIAKSIEIINTALNTAISFNTIFDYERYLSAQINLAIFKYKNDELSESRQILDAIDLNSNKYIVEILNIYLNYWKGRVYAEMGLIDESLRHENESLKSQLLLDQSRQMQLVSEYETKYQTAEKEKQLLIEQQKKKQNRNIALALGGLVIFGGITFVLIQKNTRRKQLIAEQEKEIQLQKVDGLMKKMELSAIDALIKGQEKERQRIASDLHNDLGNMITTLKLNFEALEEEPSKSKISNTKNSLQELYTKIRSISHVKNAGVLSSGGLLKSLNTLVATINETKKIHLQIQAHGMEESLVNSLELTIFRIVQELITNMLKHSKATEGFIHLTNHGDHLNIMIEDDGIGFNVKNSTKTNGMGINSIQKHVENLDGTMSIDSSPNNGSVFLINIPL